MANIIIGMIMSFVIAGLGMIYFKRLMDGFGIYLLWSILTLISIFSNGITTVIFASLSILVWLYSLYATWILAIDSSDF